MADKKPFAWSYSALRDFEECPAKLKYRREKAGPATPNVHLARGITTHKDFEDYLNGVTKRLPATLATLKVFCADIRKRGASAESEMAFTRDWLRTDWFGPLTWLRVKMDAHWLEDGESMVDIIDLKTGQPREYPEQERLYAACGLLWYPQAKRVRVRFAYSDHGFVLPERPRVYLRASSLKGIQREFALRAKRMEQEKKFLPRPGSACRFCDYNKKRKGGPCERGT